MKKLILITATVLLANALFAQVMNFRNDSLHSHSAINISNSDPIVKQINQMSTSPYLDSTFQAIMSTYHIPGTISCIIKDDEIRWVGGYGDANIDLGIQVDSTILFMLASVSKTITVTALMQLWEEGLFELDDDINEYTDFGIQNPNYPNEPITFKMLCTHTSAIQDNWDLMPNYWNGDSPIPLNEYLFDYLNPVGANYNPTLNYYNEIPGTNYHYSNIGVALMGYLVELIGDSTFSYQTQERIFEPLQMNETSWFISELDTMHVAMPYQWTGSNYIPWGHYGYSDYPSGQLRTSIGQLTNFLLCYMNGGTYLGQQILQSSTVEMMLTPQIPNINPNMGLIWAKIILDGREIIGHYGATQGVMTGMHFCPEDNTAVIFFANREDYIGYYYQDLLFDYAKDSIEIHCMPGGITFSKQEEIDNFAINYSYCIEIGGDVVISGSDITNLDGLSALISIDGDLEIHTNTVLENLSGLDSLGSINGNFKVYLNNALTDFTGLENLSAIDGHLVVAFNPLLNSLAGLDNIEPGSIDNLTISNNDKLSYCEVESICEYLVTTEGNVNIHDNAPGCNSQDEVESACTITSIEEAGLSDNLLIYPNPSSSQITVELANTPLKNALLIIYNMNGQQMLTNKITEQKTKIDISGLPKGIYYIKVADDRTMMVGKMVKK